MPERTLDKLQELQYQELLAAAEARQQVRSDRANRQRMTEMSIRNSNALEKRRQAGCFHKKGGKGASMLYQGSDPLYAVVKHTLSHGPTIVLCQRCWKVWEPPTLAPKPTAEQRAEYRRLYAEYQTALNFPTDNEPSGTVLFAFSQEPAA